MTDETTGAPPPPPTVTTPANVERGPRKKAPTTGVIIGCRLPSGITLEVGLQTLEKNADGKLFASVRCLDNYERIVLKGWHHHNTTGMQMPAGVNSNRPYLNRGVSKEAWEEWKRTHPKSWLLKNQILFEADSEATAQIKALESVDKTPTMLAPIDASKTLVPGVVARTSE